MTADQSTTDTTTEQKTTAEKFVVVSPSSLGYGGYFGKGESLAVAKTRMKEFGGTLAQYVAYEMPDGASNVLVDDFGSLRWTWAEDADRSGEPQVVASRGMKK